MFEVFRCGKKFKAQIQINGVQHYLGLFDNEEEAGKMYDAHARATLGLKAKTNFDYDPNEVPENFKGLSTEQLPTVKDVITIFKIYMF